MLSRCSAVERCFRKIACVLACTLCVGLCGYSRASAAARIPGGQTDTVRDVVTAAGCWTEDAEAPDSAAMDAAVEALVEGLMRSEACVDLSAYALPYTVLGELFTRCMNTHPELFHVQRRMGYSYDQRGRLRTVMPAYTMSGEELSEARRLYAETVEEFYTTWDLCRRQRDSAAYGPWGEADTVLLLHDWLAARYTYDTTTGEGTRYDVYQLFRDGRGVCQAYALAFLALGQAVGLQVDVVSSVVMDHAWNHVCVDGVWYHVDVTRDDPVLAQEDSSYVGHTRLLLSDQAMGALGYEAYSCQAGHVCGDTRFQKGAGADMTAASGGRAPGLLAEECQALLPLPNGWFSLQGELPVAVYWPSAGEGAESTAPLPGRLSEECLRGLPGDMDVDGRVGVKDFTLFYILQTSVWPEAAQYLPAVRSLLVQQERRE